MIIDFEQNKTAYTLLVNIDENILIYSKLYQL